MKHALVTGGGRGIGLAAALALRDAGYCVTATGIDAAEIDAMPKREGLAGVVLDVREQAAVERLIASFGRLDALVNCAGLIRRGGAEFDPATFAEVIDVNLSGTMRVCVAAKPLLAREGGAIVNTASMLSFFGGPAVPAYTASKGGIAQLTKSLAVAWAADKIRVNAVAPGWIATELTRPLYEDASRAEPILQRTPMRRWGKPEDVAGPIVFLCSEAAGFMTGVILPVDGGYAAA
ncbi:NAD(P)-dependent dehydrogenase (short-subunit alcohol dehydrogenase family) [Rhizobium aethiopicum]|uniref:NAD(P)-dependent dehydrogenase (Short-subunit alcohol dehydrogenase family) n=1 Tax=Rhizobium aethiopicum TaxID=1138170 RepID=A0A7W6QD85_9HYPH|nr:SDR family oxidoreductase [Rhizobium aethiopicum]MBB4195455.1 NAD(P)-dependent dehydrogenase (short-subunit alcohol dehydrogenase family) [Rhizobium aethiopicum]MBB4583095.1 NAD(P)-dependent dehydrogenase (short-subunit alcohol dehydrogenase family) [Rhizobium aethiopicum]